jgi:hypothetical protein
VREGALCWSPTDSCGSSQPVRSSPRCPPEDSALLVALAERHLDVGADGFGLLISAIGAGAATGLFLLTRLTDNPRRAARFVFGPYLLRGSSTSS